MKKLSILFILVALLSLFMIRCLSPHYPNQELDSTLAVSIMDIDNSISYGDIPRRASSFGMYSAIDDNNLYLLVRPSYAMSMFNESNKNWEHISYAPIGGRYCDYVLYFGGENDNLFIVMDDYSSNSSYILSFDISKKEWSRNNCYHTEASGAVMFDSTIYLTMDNQEYFAYHPLDKSIERKADIIAYYEARPYDQGDGYMCVSKNLNMIFAFYGKSAVQYSIDNDSWESIPSIPEQLLFNRYASCCLCNGTNIYIFQNYENLSYIFSYDITAKVWSDIYENNSANTKIWQYPYLFYNSNKLYCIHGQDYTEYNDIIICDLNNGSYEIKKNPFYSYYHEKYSHLQGVYHLMYKDIIMAVGGTKSYHY